MPPIDRHPIPRAKEAPVDFIQVRTEVNERLSINVFDLDRVDPGIRSTLLRGVLDLSGAVNKDRPGEAAVVFSCDLLRAATICDVLRSHDRQAGDAPTRCYIGRRGCWARLPANAVLVHVRGGGCRLNPDLFASAEPEAIPDLPPPVRSVL